MTESRMTVDERMILRGDRDPRLRATVASVAVLSGSLDVAGLRTALDRVSRFVPRLRQRAVQPSIPTTEPRWVTDPDFALDHHWRRVALPTGADWRDLLALVETILETPFDPARPQWSLTLVEGLVDGRTALVAALSPVVREGGHPLDLIGRLAGGGRADTAGMAVASVPTMPPEPVPTDLDPGDLTRHGLRELPVRALGLALGGVREAFDATLALGADPQATVGQLIGVLRGAGARVGQTAGPIGSPALAGRGASRRIVTLDLPSTRLAGLRGGPVGRAHEAAVIAALDHYHRTIGLAEIAVPIAVAAHPFDVRAALDPSSRDTSRAVSSIGAFLPALGLDLVRGPVRVGDVAAVTLGERSGVATIGGADIVAEYAVGPVPGNAVTSVVVQRHGGLHVAVRYDPAAIRNEAAFRESLEEGWMGVAPAPPVEKPMAATKKVAPVQKAAPARLRRERKS